jgi:hypothetical protein
MSWIIVAVPNCPNPSCPHQGLEFDVELPIDEETEKE